MTRPVHYHSAGTYGLRFPCYQAELRAHVAAQDAQAINGERVAPSDPRYRLLPPAPRSHTDLGKVTCPACWRSIAEMVVMMTREEWITGVQP